MSQLDETIIQRAGNQEPSVLDLAIKAEETSLRESLIPFSLLWVCRINQIVYIYLYHDWLALIVLIWVQHSMLTDSLSSFRVVTLKLYMPVFILVFLLAYITSANGLLTDDQIEGKQRYGVIKFSYPAMEVLFVQFNHLCLFAWVKSCENITAA